MVPPNAALFFNSLMQICAFDPIPTEDWWHEVLQVEVTEPVSPNFAIIGYESKWLLVNLGSFAFILIAFPFFYLISPILTPCSHSYSVERIRNFLRRNLVWSGPLRIMKESYLIVIIPALINIYVLRFTSFGEAVNSILCITFIVLMIGIPITIYRFMKKKRTALENKWIKKKYNVIYCQPSL